MWMMWMKPTDFPFHPGMDAAVTGGPIKGSLLPNGMGAVSWTSVFHPKYRDWGMAKGYYCTWFTWTCSLCRAMSQTYMITTLYDAFRDSTGFYYHETKYHGPPPAQHRCSYCSGPVTMMGRSII